MRACAAASLLVCAAVILATTSKSGEYLGRFSDHLHHPRATWNFYVLGLEVYRLGHGYACQRVAYPHDGAHWPFYPVAYPPGMFAVFTIPAVIGRFVPLSLLAWAKITIAYLVLIMHAAMWAFAALARRVGSTFWMVVAAFVWGFAVRVSLLGFYDGAWILTGALAVHAMLAVRPARAVLLFVLSALISYRAVCLAPIAAVAFWQMLRGSDTPRTKIGVTLASAVGTGIVLACFWALQRYSPHERDPAHSPFLPLFYYGYFVLAAGFAVAALVGWGASLLVGACVAFSTILAIYHGGHQWHGSVCLAPLLAMTLARRRPLWTQVVIALWLVFNLQYVFGYAPFEWLDDLLRLIERGGAPPVY